MLSTDSLYKLAWSEEKPEEHECVFWAKVLGMRFGDVVEAEAFLHAFIFVALALTWLLAEFFIQAGSRNCLWVLH